MKCTTYYAVRTIGGNWLRFGVKVARGGDIDLAIERMKDVTLTWKISPLWGATFFEYPALAEEALRRSTAQGVVVPIVMMQP